MRIACIILAILGALASAALGIKWRKDLSDVDATRKALAQMAEAANATEAKSKLAELDKLGTAAIMLLVAGALGIAGAVVVKKGMGPAAAGLLALGVVLPLIYSSKTLLPTSLLGIAAVLALLSGGGSKSGKAV